MAQSRPPVEAHAGISAGKLQGKDSAVTGALNCKVSVFGDAGAGIGAGFVEEGSVNHTMAAHSRVEALGEEAGRCGICRKRGCC